MKPDTQQYDDLRWLNHSTEGKDELPTRIKAHLSLFAKATVAVAQVEFILLVAAHERHRYLTFSCCIAATGLHDLEPLPASTQLIIWCACLTSHPPPHGSTDTHP